MNSHSTGGRSCSTTAAKRIYRVLLGLSHRLDRVVTAEWLSVSISLSAYAQLWHTYTSAVDHINDTPPGTLVSDWLVQTLTIVSYAALCLQIVLIPIYALRMLLAIALPGVSSSPPPPPPPPPPTQSVQSLPTQQQQQHESQSTGIQRMVEYGCLAPLSLLALVSNFSGIVDITRAPLLADILQGVWRLCAVFGAVVALTALPLSLRHGDSRRISWYLLFIPGVAAASTASELSMVLSESRASGVLTAGYLLWGASAAPALGLTIQNVRHRLHQGPSTKDLVVPLAPVSQLALGIMTLGIESRRVWADTVGPSTAPLLLGELAMAAGAILGLVLWAAAAAWLVNSHLIITMTAVPCNVISICGRLTESWQIVYPVASFAMATAVLARIWSSATALMLARILIAYLTVAICGLAGRALWKLWTATTIARSQRTSTSPSLTTPSSTSLYGSI